MKELPISNIIALLNPSIEYAASKKGKVKPVFIISAAQYITPAVIFGWGKNLKKIVTKIKFIAIGIIGKKGIIIKLEEISVSIIEIKAKAGRNR